MAKASVGQKGREILKSKEKFPEFNIIDYNTSLMRNMNYYNIEVDNSKKKKEWAVAYWKDQGKDVTNVSALVDGYFLTVGAVAHMIKFRDIDLDQGAVNYLEEKFVALNEYGRIKLSLKSDDDIDAAEIAAAAAAKKEALFNNELRVHLAEFDAGVDTFFTGGKLFDAKSYLIRMNVKPVMMKSVADYMKGAYQKEIKEALTGKDDQLVEAYSHLTKRQLIKFAEFIQSMIDSCEVASAITKAAKKPRAKKVKSPTELTKNTKWKTEDETIKLKSEHPAKIINATEVWVYNMKIRRLFKYVALGGTPLSIKGTTIINMDAEKSGGKIIRKPEVTLAGIQNQNSRTINKLYTDIRGTESRANGRLNEDTVIIKCF